VIRAGAVEPPHQLVVRTELEASSQTSFHHLDARFSEPSELPLGRHSRCRVSPPIAIRSAWLWPTRTPTGVVSLSDIPRRRDLSSSPDNAMLPTTMPEDSNSVSKDSQTVELGGVYTGDETELARMGYKQELKCVQVQFNSSALVFRCL
jgi:hypothetical protein